jgi:hypothetical protein
MALDVSSLAFDSWRADLRRRVLLGELDPDLGAVISVEPGGMRTECAHIASANAPKLIAHSNAFFATEVQTKSEAATRRL